jgi:uncharacterized protein YdeI (YjbR/CyaY-like superfamily)
MTNLPQDFLDALRTAGLANFFAEATHAHQREYLRWITEAKRPETRAKRIQQAVERIAQKRAEEAARTKQKQS